jgi:hypothetical protein
MCKQIEFDFMKKSEKELKEISKFSLLKLKQLLELIITADTPYYFTDNDLKEIIYLSKWIAEEDIK